MPDAFSINWQSLIGKIQLPNRAFINGQSVKAINGNLVKNLNPATGETLTKMADCNAADADVAVESARFTFESGTWSQRAPKERKEIMLKWAQLIEEHHAEIALLESLDTGKPISDTYDIDVPSALNTIRWTAEAIDKLYDEIAPTPSNTLALIERVPLGVILAIVPWNFPLSTTAWKLAPAIATGNSVILKPDPKTPMTAIRLAQLAIEAGIPPGVLNVLPGDGENLGRHLSLHPDIDGQTFTGSTNVGKLLMQYAGQSNLKRTFLELGGKSAHIVFADGSLDSAAEMAAMGGFYNSGQTCTAGTRLLVQESIHDEFVSKVVAHSKQWQSGDPLNPQTKMGAIINQDQLNRIQHYVDIGIKEGAKLILGGQASKTDTGGYFYEATIFDQVDNAMQIAQEEIFGPVLSIITFKDEADAIRIANDSIYGLAGGVWSQNLNTALRVAKSVRTGTMGVNNYFGGDITVPFGGFKQSGNGRDKSMHAMHDYTELKTTWIEVPDV